MKADKAIVRHYPENNQTIILYPNGYGLSRICNTFSHGIEILVLTWKPRGATRWERFMDCLRTLTVKPMQEPFYYEAKDVRGDILKMPSDFNGASEESFAVYAYLDPEKEEQVKTKVEQLERIGKCL